MPMCKNAVAVILRGNDLTKMGQPRGFEKCPISQCHGVG